MLMKSSLLYLVGQLSLGGLERQLYDLLRVMDRERYKPVVAVWGNSPDGYYVEYIRALGVPIVHLGENSSRIAKFRALRRLVVELQPEVIHSYTFYTNVAAWWVAQGTTAIPIGSIQNTFTFERRATGKVLSRLCGRWPSGQVYNSFNAMQDARHSSTMFQPPRIYVVTNGVDLDKFMPRPYPHGGYLLAVGRLAPEKRWDRLIRAVALLASKGIFPEVRHAGTGPLREELEEMTRTLHVDHLVRFLGARHDVPDLLAGAAFFVHTADAEGCPNVVLETMAGGRAVVATGAGDIPHLVDDGKTGFVVSMEEETVLANRIEILLGDHDLCRRMGDAGRKKAEQAFGLDRFRDQIFEAYRAEGWKGR